MHDHFLNNFITLYLLWTVYVLFMLHFLKPCHLFTSLIFHFNAFPDMKCHHWYAACQWNQEVKHSPTLKLIGKLTGDHLIDSTVIMTASDTKSIESRPMAVFTHLHSKYRILHISNYVGPRPRFILHIYMWKDINHPRGWIHWAIFSMIYQF